MLASIAARHVRTGLARSLLHQRPLTFVSAVPRAVAARPQWRAISSTPAVKAEAEAPLASESPKPKQAPPPPKPISRLRTFAKYTFFLTASAGVGLFTLTAAIFLHDAFTYTEKVRVSNHTSCRCYGSDPMFVAH